MPGSAGTNWWKAVFSPASVTDANLRISGGGADNAYNVSFNFLNQNGTAAYNRLQRGTVRVNTTFNLDRFIVRREYRVVARATLRRHPER